MPLVSSCTVQTVHSVTRPPDHPATEYLTCVTIPGPLQQVSYSCHDPHRCPPCRTYHLHTMRQANVNVLTNKIKVVESMKCLGFKFKSRQDNDSSQSNQGTNHLVSQFLIPSFLLYMRGCDGSRGGCDGSTLGAPTATTMVPGSCVKWSHIFVL
jgi:hypothetical protein